MSSKVSQSNFIIAELAEIKYQAKLIESLDTFNESELINGELHSKGSFILNLATEEVAMSQWVTPKRTRTFPFARVYNTLSRKNRVTIIPFCKDEGADGDRDFLQWDTVSLMSLLNVYVIVGYYIKAEKNKRPRQEIKNKITNQIFDYVYISKKLNELSGYQSSALHWNLKQMEELSEVAKLTLSAYQKIQSKTGVSMHGEKGIAKRIELIEKDVIKFKSLSRELAQQAQHREQLTDQPKEKTIGTKATVTLKNLLGGFYYWTVDECFVQGGCVFLVEKKHSKHKLLPSKDDVKDAFIKLALFSNISKLKYNGKAMQHYSAVGLTSNNIIGVLHSKMSDEEHEKFFNMNKIKPAVRQFISTAIDEARCNHFGLFIINAKDANEKQMLILRELNE